MRKRDFIPIVAVLLVLPGAAHAQDGFLFGSPKAQITLRAGPVLHRAGGDLFGFFRDELTLGRGDFSAPAIGGELAIAVHDRVDVTLGASWANVEMSSEFEDWVDEGPTDSEDDDLPIAQMTALRTIPLTASVRYYLMSRGTGISELAWVPSRWTPYVGAGGGFTWYRLRQNGDFVDTEDLTIFTADFESSGRATTFHVLGGVDHWLTPKFGLNLEGRYSFGSAPPGGDYEGWDEVDLSGFQLGVGLALRW